MCSEELLRDHLLEYVGRDVLASNALEEMANEEAASLGVEFAVLPVAKEVDPEVLRREVVAGELLI